ncbi:MAG: glycine cleavage system aminomethyltransferase GcvT [Nitrospinota bacterium]|nr:MAG: glycine cleavage system aminomethyltransferase GcvT [Nitrospinota bacterium]
MEKKAEELKRTPLFPVHQALGARLIPFAGWEMPVQYRSIVEEHLAVRRSVGLFDISHMGEIEVRGREALAFLQRLLTNDVSKLALNQVQYTVMCEESGGIIDDLTVYRLEEETFLLVVNAANIETDYEWIRSHAPHGVEVINRSYELTLLAVQGKNAENTVQKLTSTDLSALKYYWATRTTIAGVEVLISRTGYTGEDGFELYFDNAHARKLWEAIMDAGAPYQIQPIGLGARDTLRLEMRYLLYGNDMTREHTPLQAGLSWVVKLDKGDFIGRPALLREKEKGVSRRLVGFKMQDRGIARPHYPIWAEGQQIGVVTSGTFSPSLQQSIGLGYVSTAYARIGTPLEIEIRGKRYRAEVVKTPFYPSQVKR